MLFDDLKPLDHLPSKVRRTRRGSNTYGSRLESRHARAENPPPDLVTIYNWIESVQRKLGLSNKDFAAKFADILSDPEQSCKFYRNRNGVIPGPKILARLSQLENSLNDPTRDYRQVIYFSNRRGAYIRLYWSNTERQFIAVKVHAEIVSEEEHANAINRFRGKTKVRATNGTVARAHSYDGRG